MMQRRFFWCCALICGAAAAQDTRQVTEPVVPPVCAVVNAQRSGADSSREADDTERLQQAISACAPGHALRLAAANGNAAFTAGPLVLKSGVTLLLDAGVTLYASTNPRRYDSEHERCGIIDKRGHGCRPFLSAGDTDGSGIMGDGVIDGQGGHAMDGRSETWWQLARRAQKELAKQNVPRLLEVNRSRNFTLYRITLANSANFHVTLNQVDGFTAWNTRIDSPHDARNTDGIDPVSSRNITIAYSFIRTGDDNVAIKGGKLGPAENISVLHNQFYNGHGMSIGSETDGGVRHVLVEDLSMDGATSGLRIKSDVSRGGPVSDIRYRSVCLRNVRAPIDFDTRYDPKAVGYRVPVYSGITLENVHSLTPGRLIVRGYDESHVLSFAFNNVVIDGDSTVQAANARFALGPGPVVPAYSGDNVKTTGETKSAPAEPCETRFAAFPARAVPAAAPATRPQLSDADADRYSYRQVMQFSQAHGNNTADPWDPLSDALVKGDLPVADYIFDAAAPADGARTFHTVQAAINRAVREAAAKPRVYIVVKPGVYHELVYVPDFPASVTLIGGDADASRTRISVDLDANVTGKGYREKFGGPFEAAPAPIAAMFAAIAGRETITTYGSAVAWIRNKGFQARNITFENTYNRAHGDAFKADGSPAVHSQAVAMMVDDADKVQFENVRFASFQDTLFLHASTPQKTVRSFFRNAYIEGDLDFIFGEATGYFYRTEIKTLGDRRVSYVTAPDTDYAGRYGFVFNESRFTHDGSANALAGVFYLGRQWFHNQRCTPFGTVTMPPGYSCKLGTVDRYDAPAGTITKGVLETVGKVIILNSTIGNHIDKAHPWSDWNAAGTQKHRPAQYNSDDYWNNLQAVGIDPIGQLGYRAKKVPVEPFLAEYRNRDE